ncbi:hypothetical protein FPZ43_02345 [Mucilaginibacter pallidiroseus]|uniref:Uncharacterized protein n=1 Tax=Mucilaginibacter pallidiroseus TaxID=2599295 RepID=A0A563UIZ8_9SPHI|nr:hypothetical protein [Mucilaginibacter pallidiroseus]TWR31337.1 hypothetical protein FPZ43_02345 [Mucilaginibacter pallidiroseus]
MKKLFTLAALSFVLASCTDNKVEEQNLLKEVIKVHDRVMAKDELIIVNKMMLDALILKNISTGVTEKARVLDASLDSADTRMEGWMHKFDAENKGKSHDEVMAYLTAQKKEIEHIDSLFNISIKKAADFIKENPTK